MPLNDFVRTQTGLALLLLSIWSLAPNAEAAPVVVAGPAEFNQLGDQRESPVPFALVADSARLESRENYRDLFRIVELPPDRDVLGAMVLLEIPDLKFHYVYPPPPMVRGAAMCIDAEHRRLYITLAKTVGESSSVVFYAYNFLLDPEGAVSIQPIPGGPSAVAASETVTLDISLTDQDAAAGAIRFIEMAVLDGSVRVELRDVEDDLSPVVYEVRATDWTAHRIP